MLYWIIQISIISIILIFLLHYLFIFFKETLTVPKIKDLVNVPNKKYENMYNIISKNNGINGSNESANYTDIDLLPIQPDRQSDRQLEENIEPKWDKSTDADSMKSELKSFFKKQLKDSSNDISSLSSTPNSSSYSYSDY
jgi:hypothetical protein